MTIGTRHVDHKAFIVIITGWPGHIRSNGPRGQKGKFKRDREDKATPPSYPKGGRT